MLVARSCMFGGVELHDIFTPYFHRFQFVNLSIYHFYRSREKVFSRFLALVDCDSQFIRVLLFLKMKQIRADVNHTCISFDILQRVEARLHKLSENAL